MRTTTPLIFGLVLVPGALLLNTQEQTLADTDVSASQIGLQVASILSKPAVVKHERTVVKHIQRTESVSPRKRVVATIVETPVAESAPDILPVLNKPDIEMRHKLIANNVLLSLPAKCRNTLQTFYVRYEKPKNRGLAGKSVMILDGTVSDEEFRALFVHESGHNWDLGCFRGTLEGGKSPYSDGETPIYKDDPSVGFYSISFITSKVQRSNMRPEDFVSGYASYDIFEDFAESFAYFVLQNSEFRTRAQDNAVLAQKYNWILTNIFDGEIPKIATGKSNWNQKVPWDITKLKYEWNGEELTLAQNKY
ncbi:MAG: hypothetical protein QF815_03195 [Candidatus Peribacteraceae bacterium]|jgi:hypothetical protein|nr:hypothetical protein [Candidatus Peribacteraceae bacterium]